MVQLLLVAQPQGAVRRPVAGRQCAFQDHFFDPAGGKAAHVADVVADPHVAIGARQHAWMVEGRGNGQGLQAVRPQPVQASRGTEPQIALAVLERRLRQRAADAVLARQALGRQAGAGRVELALNAIGLHQPHGAGAVEADAVASGVGPDGRIAARRAGAHAIVIALRVDGPDGAIGRFIHAGEHGARPGMGKARFSRPAEKYAMHGAHPLRAIAAEQDLVHALVGQSHIGGLRHEAVRAGRQAGCAIARADPDGAVRCRLDVEHGARGQAIGRRISARAAGTEDADAAQAVADPDGAVRRRGQSQHIARWQPMAVDRVRALEAHAVVAVQAGGRGDPQPAVAALGKFQHIDGRALQGAPGAVRVIGQQRRHGRGCDCGCGRMQVERRQEEGGQVTQRASGHRGGARWRSADCSAGGRPFADKKKPAQASAGFFLQGVSAARAARASVSR
ncbi:hypothetical protein D3C81_491960 [compost metagenome]